MTRRPRFPKPLPYYGKFYDNGGQSIALNSGRSNLNWPVYRYAETLLLHAEAENEAVGPGATRTRRSTWCAPGQDAARCAD